MDILGNGNKGVPKFREFYRKPRLDSEDGRDSPEVKYIYDDTDYHQNEISEIYSYTEQPEFQLNVKNFEDQMEAYGLIPCWQKLTPVDKNSVIAKLLDQLEVSNRVIRMRSARCFLYLAQGCWGECQSDDEQYDSAVKNCIMLYKFGVFHAFIDLLNLEIDSSSNTTTVRKLAVSLHDSTDLRIILSVLCTIVEVIRHLEPNVRHSSVFEMLKNEISNPIGDELLAVKLFKMVTRFCSGATPHFPMKKVLILLWKVILVSLGGMKDLQELKKENRKQNGLKVLDEDTIEIAKTMRPSSPPASAVDIIEAQNQKRNSRPLKRLALMKQSSLDEPAGGEFEPEEDYEDPQVMEVTMPQPPSPTPIVLEKKVLPWSPKVRQKELDMFLEAIRMKFVGFALRGDRDSLIGLPHPIHESVKVLKQHIYTSLSEVHIQKEEEINRSPMSLGEETINSSSTEILYQKMLPNLPQYMIALLKILLAAAPTSKAKTDSINILSDVLPEEMPMTILQSMKLGTDVNRHKEIIVKAISSILLLLLKHFKLNHVYQFEFMSQHLVFANCIPLVLKFFNQNISMYISAKSVIPILDFPACVIGDQPELTSESFEIGEGQTPHSWRNLVSCINLLRILNKLTKWKHSRIMMLVIFKSAPILKRTLKVRHAMMQLYVLKLLKMQTKYLGRQWRKSNMKTISAIYAKVRHRLNDDWAYGNDLDARPWDFQAEECALRASVDRFNSRRYNSTCFDSDYESSDCSIGSVLSHPIELTEDFKQHYEIWLEREVFQLSINWDDLLDN
uniref:Striatin-interacting protein 1 n=1 Tax=Cacopsylla melanoneura TaxID=428564 RepID=A0A8D8SPD5_9HEMI